MPSGRVVRLEKWVLVSAATLEVVSGVRRVCEGKVTWSAPARPLLSLRGWGAGPGLRAPCPGGRRPCRGGECNWTLAVTWKARWGSHTVERIVTLERLASVQFLFS